jgi:hypothetical protein
MPNMRLKNSTLNTFILFCLVLSISNIGASDKRSSDISLQSIENSPLTQNNLTYKIKSELYNPNIISLNESKKEVLIHKNKDCSILTIDMNNNSQELYYFQFHGFYQNVKTYKINKTFLL